jgi:hypothetical protein
MATLWRLPGCHDARHDVLSLRVQLFQIMQCFGRLTPSMMETMRKNPLFVGVTVWLDLPLTPAHVRSRFHVWMRPHSTCGWVY